MSQASIVHIPSGIIIFQIPLISFSPLHAIAFLSHSFKLLTILPENWFQSLCTTKSKSGLITATAQLLGTSSPFLLLWLNTWPKQIKKWRIYFGSQFENAVMVVRAWGNNYSFETEFSLLSSLCSAQDPSSRDNGPPIIKQVFFFFYLIESFC